MNDPLLKDFLKPLFVILIFGIVFQIIYESRNKGQTKLDKYKEVCEQTGGTVVWNERNYECLK